MKLCTTASRALDVLKRQQRTRMLQKKKTKYVEKRKQYWINHKLKIAKQEEEGVKSTAFDKEEKSDNECSRETEVCSAVDQYKLGCKMSSFSTEKILSQGSTASVLAVKLGEHKFSLKVIALEPNSKKEMSDFYKREIVNLGKLLHDNIILFFGYFETSESLCMVFERGTESIEERLQKDKRFEECQATSFLHQICSGLQFMHSLGLTHCDVNPSNIIMMSDETTVKLADFNTSERATMSKKRTLVESSEYIAPEALDGSGNFSCVDMWSVGVCFYQFLTGVTPFAVGRGDLPKQFYLVPETMSIEAKKVIKTLLVDAPSKRATAEKIIDNLWIQKMVEEEKSASVKRHTDKIRKSFWQVEQDQQKGCKPEIDNQIKSDASPAETFQLELLSFVPSEDFVKHMPIHHQNDPRIEFEEKLHQKRKLNKKLESEFADYQRRHVIEISGMAKENSTVHEETTKLMENMKSKAAVIRRLQDEIESLQFHIDELSRSLDCVQVEREKYLQSIGKFSYWNFLPPEMKSECIKKMDFMTRWMIRRASKIEKSLADALVKYIDYCSLDDQQLFVLDEYRDNITEGVDIYKLDKQNFNKKVESFLTHALSGTFIKSLRFVDLSDAQLQLVSNKMLHNLHQLQIQNFQFSAKLETDFLVGISILKKAKAIFDQIEFVAGGNERDLECPIEKIFSLDQVIKVKDSLSMMGFATECVNSIIKRWSMNEMEIGSKLRVDDDDSMDEICKMFEDRKVSSNFMYLRITTNNPEKHIILVRGLVSNFGTTVNSLCGFVISAALKASEYESNPQFFKY